MWCDFRWIEANERAIAEHGLTPDDVEAVVCRTRPTRAGHRFVAVGRTRAGRKIKVIYELDDAITVFVVTAYPVR